MKRKLSPEDLRLWQAQVKGVAPLAKKKKTPEESPLPKLPLPKPLGKNHDLSQYQHRSLKEAKKGSVHLPTFGRKELRHLKIDGRLDLHGMTLDEGYNALERYLIHAQIKGFKIVLIITGKGALSAENTLRRQLPRWIKETPLHSLVSAFHAPARQEDGGSGACYIGVRKRGK